jgi:hypothetical protein
MKIGFMNIIDINSFSKYLGKLYNVWLPLKSRMQSSLWTKGVLQCSKQNFSFRLIWLIEFSKDCVGPRFHEFSCGRCFIHRIRCYSK